MTATELTSSGWKKNSVVLGFWTNRADVVRDFSDGILVRSGVVVNTKDGNDVLNAVGTNVIVPGVSQIGFTNRGTLNLEGGNDTIKGSANNFGILNGGTVNAGNGNDSIEGSAGAAGVGLSNSGRIFTGQGSDSIKGTSGGVGIINTRLIDTGDGKDTIDASGRAGGLTNEGLINTGNGDDIIRSRGLGQGLVNARSINMGSGDDLLEGGAVSNSISNSGRINMEDGNDVVVALKNDPQSGKPTSPGEFAGGGTIDLGSGEDLIIGFGNQKVVGGSGRDIAILGLPFDDKISLGTRSGNINITANGSTMSFSGVEQFVFSTGQVFTFQQLQAMV